VRTAALTLASIAVLAAGCGRDCDLFLADGHVCVKLHEIHFDSEWKRIHFAVHVERDVAWALDHWHADASVLDGWEFEFHKHQPTCYFGKSDGCVEPWHGRVKIYYEWCGCPTHILPHEIGHLTKSHYDPAHHGWGWDRADRYLMEECDPAMPTLAEENHVRAEMGLPMVAGVGE
jgi:hypothetical protein